MAYVSLYRKYRPATWDKVIGQNHIVTTLINQIKAGSVGHAYLFTGTRGTGKTSSAKIFARAVNCLSPVNGSPCGKCEVCKALGGSDNIDIIEMDAASNNGVDEIRELKENVQYPPTVGKYKVYIIDEVHMLSPSAFNALLKTLEEPPAHVIFILATTEVHKLPQTILSRCMRFDFRLVSKSELTDLLGRIFDDIGYKYEREAAEILAVHGEGSVRDTLSLADMCLSYSPDKLTADAVLEVLGASDFGTLHSLASSVLRGDVATILSLTDKVYERGKGLSTLNKELAEFFRELITVKNVKGYRGGYNDEELKAVGELADRYDNFRIARAMKLLAGVENALRYSTQPRIIFEAVLVQAAEMNTETGTEALVSRVTALERQLRDMEFGGYTVKAESKPAVSAQEAAERISALSKKDTVTEETPVFDSTPVLKPASDKAVRLMGLIITELRESGYGILYQALRAQEDYDLDGKTLTVRVRDAASYTQLTDPAYEGAISAALKAVTGDNGYSFKCVGEKKETGKAKPEDRMRLVDLFGSKLTEKK